MITMPPGCVHLGSQGEGHRGEAETGCQRLECTDSPVLQLQDSRRTPP